MKKTYTVACDDPAPKNYGRCFLRVSIDETKLKVRIKKAGILKYPLKSEDIKTDIGKVLKRYRLFTRMEFKKKPDIYAAERFMPRGSTVQHGEAISFMLATNIHVLSNVYCKLISAVTWKSQIKRYFDLKQLYKDIKPCPDHLLDATLIGLYVVYVKQGIKPYSTMKNKHINSIVSKLKEIGTEIKDAELKVRGKKGKKGNKPEEKTGTTKGKKNSNRKVRKGNKQ